jgi:hypothetical protein
MFRENEDHLQFGLFDTLQRLPEKVRQRLEASWVRIPVMSSIDSGHVVHPRDRSGASIDIVQSSGQHGQGRTELAL